MPALPTRDEVMRRVIQAAEAWRGWGPLWPVREAILAELRRDLERGRTSHLPRGRALADALVIAVEMSGPGAAKLRADREHREARAAFREFCERLPRGGRWGRLALHRRISERSPGTVAAEAERRRTARLVLRHGDALASVIRVMQYQR